VNIKIILEGEEEVGSANLDDFVKANKPRLAADVVVISDSAMFARGVPSICYGLRGLVYFQIDLRGSSTDLHSGVFGGAVANPAFVLAQMLAQMKDRSGHIKIPGFYDDVVPLQEAERQAWSQLPFNEKQYRKDFGIPKVHGESGFSTLERTWARPTFEVNGLLSGFTGEGAKTVLPAQAMVKIDFRLVPDMVPEKQLERLKKHLKLKGFGDIEVKFIHGEAAARTPIRDPFVRQVQQAARETFGSAITSVSSAGTGPMHSFVKVLRAPCISIGSTYMFARIHSPNEFARIDLLNKTTKCIGRIMERFAG
jgi:acetylornithine deacetylase/succinyl-diaminopimelate desuccinylase-like protein